MIGTMRWLVLCALSSAFGCAKAFVCNEDTDCNSDVDGVCQADGHCSFPDDTCPSGQRYAEHSGAMSGQCVELGTGTSTSDVTIADDTTLTSPTSASPESSGPGPTDDTADTTSAVSASTTTATTSTTTAAETSTTDPADSSSTGDPLDPDLLLWLRFEDEDAFVNDGTLGGVAACEAGCPLQEGGLATFVGTDDCLVAPLDDAFSSAAFTAAAWLWRNDEVDDFYYYVFGKSFGDRGQNSWELFIAPDADLVPVLRAHIAQPVDVVVEMSMPPSREWIHVGVIWDGATLQLWLDGEAVAQANAAAVSYDDHAVQIGCDHNTVVQEGHLGGRLDDVRVYSRALDDAEMAALAASAPPPP
jgi:hypothetical protein